MIRLTSVGYLSGWELNSSNAWIRRTAASGTKADSSAGADELLAANQLDITDFGGSDLGVAGEVTSIPVSANGGTGGISSPLEIMNRVARKMDEANVDTADRWFVADPVFFELLMDENSKFVSADFGGGEELRNGRVGDGLVRGFRVYKSNNLPYVGNGAGEVLSTGSETNFGVVVAGHNSAVATAQQLNKVETYRDTASFADICRGMQLYGRKILRPEAIITANYNVA